MAALLSLSGGAVATLLAAVFLRAAWHKAAAFLETVGVVRDYRLIPDAWAAPVVRALTLAEALVVLALVLPATRSLGALGAAVLLTGYGAAMAAVLRSGRTAVDCGCGGAPQPISPALLARNAILAGLAVALAVLPPVPMGPAGAAVSVLGGLTLWALLGLGEAIHANTRHLRRPG